MIATTKKLRGNIVDLENRSIFHGELLVENGVIQQIIPLDGQSDQFILPGFVDAHVHIESSMLVPSEFARLAVTHGTIATVSDPHEIANVMGIKGVRYMIENGKKVPFKFNFGAPSCVPATSFETAGAKIDVEEIETLLNDPDILYLAEMMNYPGVIYQDEAVMAKIALAKQCGKPIDGHAPGLRGQQAKQYVEAGISTDHECYTYEEAREKIGYGMKILIREGSAAKNFTALIPLLAEFPEKIMFCSDDKHPDDLLEGHINLLVKRALAEGFDLFDVLRAACYHPVQHYQLPVGLLRVDDPADFIIVENLESFKISSVYIDGQAVVKNGKSLIPAIPITKINQFNTSSKSPKDFRVAGQSGQLAVIKALDGEIVTEGFEVKINGQKDYVESNLSRDILKIAVVNRYSDTPPAVAFINGFGLKQGALASCVAHDSHNIIAVGVSDEAIARAVNLIIENKGGISVVTEDKDAVLPLPIAGIMSDGDAHEVGRKYAAIDRLAKNQLGCILKAPFMTLSFMALLVIPKLKLSDKGLFDGASFKFTPLFK